MANDPWRLDNSDFFPKDFGTGFNNFPNTNFRFPNNSRIDGIAQGSFAKRSPFDISEEQKKFQALHDQAQNQFNREIGEFTRKNNAQFNSHFSPVNLPDPNEWSKKAVTNSTMNEYDQMRYCEYAKRLNQDLDALLKKYNAQSDEDVKRSMYDDEYLNLETKYRQYCSMESTFDKHKEEFQTALKHFRDHTPKKPPEKPLTEEEKRERDAGWNQIYWRD